MVDVEVTVEATETAGTPVDQVEMAGRPQIPSAASGIAEGSLLDGWETPPSSDAERTGCAQLAGMSWSCGPLYCLWEGLQ